jgi:hypothetical protein
VLSDAAQGSAAEPQDTLQRYVYVIVGCECDVEAASLQRMEG